VGFPLFKKKGNFWGLEQHGATFFELLRRSTHRRDISKIVIIQIILKFCFEIILKLLDGGQILRRLRNFEASMGWRTEKARRYAALVILKKNVASCCSRPKKFSPSPNHSKNPSSFPLQVVESQDQVYPPEFSGGEKLRLVSHFQPL